MIEAASKPKEVWVDIEWHYQVRLYGWGDFCTLRILKKDYSGLVYITPHIQFDPDKVSGEFEVSYGPWRLYRCGTVVKLDHHGQKVGMKVYVMFWQATLKVAPPPKGGGGGCSLL